jgi:hypothetical protein
MKFRQLSLSCECGRAPSRLKRVGFTPQHQLVVHWQCPACKKEVYFVKDLSACWRECPRPEDAPESAEAANELVREPDAQFLHSLGIKFPDERER